MHSHTHAHACIRAHAHMCVHAHTYKCTHTHTHTCSLREKVIAREGERSGRARAIACTGERRYPV